MDNIDDASVTADMICADCINMDYAANVPKKVNIKLYQKLSENCFNINSDHLLGNQTKKYYDKATKVFLEYFPEYEDVKFIPGGGTITNGIAILETIPYKPKTIKTGLYQDIVIISNIEHKSINDIVFNKLLLRGYTVIKVPVNKDGVLILKTFRKIVNKYLNRIALISIMLVNNEIGTIQPISEVCEFVKKRNDLIIIHSDIAQGIRFFNNVANQPDIITISSYKFGGPHLGILLAKKGIKFNNIYFGTPDICSIYLSAESFIKYMEIKTCDTLKIYIKKSFESMFKKLDLDVIIIPHKNSAYHIQSYILPSNFEAKTIQKMLSKKGILIGTGSACSSIDKKGSHVVIALGYPDRAFSLIRLSFDENDVNLLDRVNYVIAQFKQILIDLKGFSIPTKHAKKTKTTVTIFKLDDKSKAKNLLRSTTPLNLSLLPNFKFDVIKISIGELYLKKGNKNYFNSVLKNNIKNIMDKDKMRLYKYENYYLLIPLLKKNININSDEHKNREGNEIDFDKLIKNLQNVPGIGKIYHCYRINYSDLESKEDNLDNKDNRNNCLIYEINRVIATIIKNKLINQKQVKFRMTCRCIRSRIKKYSSGQMNCIFGQYIVDRFNKKEEQVKVDLKNYDINICVELHKKYALIHLSGYNGCGGLPVGSESSLYCLIDKDNLLRSIASSHMMVKRGSIVKFIVPDGYLQNSNIATIIDNIFGSFNSGIKCIPYSKLNNKLDSKYIYIYEQDNLSNYIDNQKMYDSSGVVAICNTILLQNSEIDKYLKGMICGGTSRELDSKLKLKLQFKGEFKAKVFNSILEDPFKPSDSNNLKDSLNKYSTLMMLSGGIDSPVASYLLMKFGICNHFIHFTSHINKVDKVINILKVLKGVVPNNKIKLFVIDFAELQDEIVRICGKSLESYRTLLYKMFMVIISNRIAKQHNIDLIGTGNSWGQVSSQTPHNIKITRIISEKPIISPLLGFDKTHIMSIARTIDTYNLSICDSTNDCCTMYMPKYPVTKGNLNIVQECISQVDSKYIDKYSGSIDNNSTGIKEIII